MEERLTGVLATRPPLWSDASCALAARRLPENAARAFLERRNPEDKALGLATRLLLLLRALKTLGLEAALSSWAEDRNGRPYLQAAPEGFDFNLSHTEGLAVCAFSTRGRVGVDVERVRRSDFSDYAFLFTDEERRGVENAESREEEFFRLWTMKEAVVKADGLAFLRGDERVRNLLADCAWRISRVELLPGFVCHLATESVCRVETELLAFASVAFRVGLSA